MRRVRSRTRKACFSRCSFWNGPRGGRGGQPRRCSFFRASAIGCNDKRTPPTTTRRLASVVRRQSSRISQSSRIRMSFSLAGNAMDVLWDIVVSVGRGIEQVLVYVETHHWIFGFLVIGYIFYLHDRALHARFDALDKRIDEIRKRLAVEY